MGNVAMVSPLSYTLLSNICPSRRGRNSAKLFTYSFSLHDACPVLMGAEFEFQREVDTLYSVSTTLGQELFFVLLCFDRFPNSSVWRSPC